MKLPKYKQVAEKIRAQIADGLLAPGAYAPSGAALARSTGYSSLTCRHALHTLVEDGVLTPGPSRYARPRVPSPDRHAGTLTDVTRELAAALAERRRAAGLTQPQLAEITGDSVTAIGHAETSRMWHSRPFWERTDKALNAGGQLLRLYGTYRAASVPTDPAPVVTETAPMLLETLNAEVADLKNKVREIEALLKHIGREQ